MELCDVIKIISEAIPQGSLWGVGGSLMLQLKGIDVQSNDIDIVCDERAYFALKEKFKKCIYPKETTKLFCSNFAMRLSILEKQIDIISGFKINTDNGVFTVPLDNYSITETVQFNEVQVPLLSLEDWFFIYTLKNDIEKIKMINKYWQTHIIHEYLFNRNLQQCKILKLTI